MTRKPRTLMEAVVTARQRKPKRVHKFDPDWATHPGEHIAEWIAEYKWTQLGFANACRITPKLLSDIIAGKARVSVRTAIKLEQVYLKAETWLALQASYDLFHERKRKGTKP